MIDPERIQRLAEKMGNRNDALELVRQMRCGGRKFGEGGPEKKRLFDKKKIADRIPADGGYPGGTSGVIDAVRHYLSNDDNYVGDRIRDAMIDASRGALDPESLSQMLAHEDAKRIYLGMPQEYGSFEPSPYRPTIGSMDDPYQLNGLLSDSSFENTILPMYATWKTGKDWPLYDTGSRVTNLGKTAQLSDFPYLHRAGMSEGFDDKGQYISLQDTWDYNTAVKGRSGDNVGKWIGGKPFDIYQRYYLDDWLDVPDEAKGNPYIAPSYIEADYTGPRYVPDYTFWGLPQDRGELDSTNEFGCGGKKYGDGGDSGQVRDNTRVSSVIASDVGYVPAMERPLPMSLGNARLDSGVSGVLPFVGDALQGWQAIRDFKNHDWVTGMQTAGLLFAPNIIEKPLKGIFSSPFKDYKQVFDRELFKEIERGAYRDVLAGRAPSIPLPKESLGRVMDMPEDVKRVLWNSTLPRLKATHPDVDVDAIWNREMARAKYTEYPAETYANAGEAWAAGHYSPDTGNIGMKEGSPRIAVLPHEGRHRLDAKIPLTEDESGILGDAFGQEFLDLPNTVPELKGYNSILKDEVTTNADARMKLLGEMHSQRTSPELQNKIIAKKTDEQIVKAVEESNFYGRKLIESLRASGKLTPERINKFRIAMQKVPTVAGIGYLGNALYNGYKEQEIRDNKYPGGGRFFRTSLQNESPMMYQPMKPWMPDVSVPMRFVPEPDLGDYVPPSSTGMAESYPVTVSVPSPRVDLGFVEPGVVEDVVDLFSDEAKARRRLKQRYAESRFNNKAVSKAGAKGAWQIMPITLKDYLGRGRGKAGDLNDPEYNGKIRDWVMGVIPRDLQEFWSDDDSDINKLAKLYAAYNWGAGSLRNYLRKRQKAGKSIDDPYEWVEDLNPETRRYVKYLAFDEDIPDSSYTNTAFEDAARSRGYMAEGGRLYEMGGPEKTWQEIPLSYASEGQLFRPLQPLRDPVGNDKFVYTFGNWLNNRRDILAKNMADTGMDSGGRRYFALPLYNTLGLSKEEKAVNDELESQLARVEDAGYVEKLLPLFTHGQYNTKKNTVELSTVLGDSGNPKDVVALHEYGHALGQGSPQEEVIRRHFSGRPVRDKYLDDPSEIYTRLMTFRKLHNIDPNKVYTLADIKELRGEAKKDFDEVITKPWTEHDKLQAEYAKKLADFLYPKLRDKVKDKWWWKRNGGGEGFYRSLKSDFIYARDLANQFGVEIPSEIQEIFDRSIKVINNDNSLQGVRYSEDNDFFKRMSDEDMLFLLNEVADSGDQESLYGNHLGNISAKGGRIHIKPSHRGRLTELKARTGKTEAELYNDGNPAHKRMVVFARNSRKWKHGDGGYLDNYFYDGGPYGVIPLGGDYLTYLQTMPEVSGGAIDPSVVTAALPEKFNGSQAAAARYAEGYQKGAKPVSEAISRAGQDIFNTVDTVVGLTPTPAGAITWLGHMGADAAEGEWGKVGRDVVLAAALGAGARGIGWLKNYVDDATNFGEDIFRAFTDRVPGRVSTNFVYDVSKRPSIEPGFWSNKALGLMAKNGNAEAAAELATRPYEIENLGGGYMLKSLMRGNPLEKQISKNGTVNVNNVRALVGKGGKVEQAVVDKVLAEKFAGQKSVDYNQFRKAVQDELISWNKAKNTKYEDYGLDRLGYTVIKDPAGESIPPVYGDDIASVDTYTFQTPRIKTGSSAHYNPDTQAHMRTFTSADDPDVLYVLENQSDKAQGNISDVTRHVMHDAHKKNLKGLEKLLELHKNGEIEIDGLTEEDIYNAIEKAKLALKTDEIYIPKPEGAQDEYLMNNVSSRLIQENLKKAAESGQRRMRFATPETAAKIEGYSKEPQYTSAEDIAALDKMDAYKQAENILNDKYGNTEAPKVHTIYDGKILVDSRTGNTDVKFNSDYTGLYRVPLGEGENYQSIVNSYADPSIRAAVDKLDVPEMAKKYLEEYQSYEERLRHIDNAIADVSAKIQISSPKTPKDELTKDYGSNIKTILKKYADFPKQFKKLYKNADVRIVTDPKGNTWYEVDVPEGYLQQEWAYEEGGSLILPKMMMDKHSPDKLRKAIANIKAGRMK